MVDNQKILYKFIQINTNIDWSNISCYYKLSENFIREFQNKVDWSSISRCQTLSETFIREFQDKIDWYWISENQTLSENGQFVQRVEYGC